MFEKNTQKPILQLIPKEVWEEQKHSKADNLLALPFKIIFGLLGFALSLAFGILRFVLGIKPKRRGKRRRR